MGITGALIGGAATIGGAMISANAAGKAADAQAQAGADQLALQKYMFEQGRTDQAPWRTVGGRSLNELAALYGIQPYGPGDEGYPQTGGGTRTNSQPGAGTDPTGTGGGGGYVDPSGRYIGPPPGGGSVPRGDSDYLDRLRQIDAGDNGTPGMPNGAGFGDAKGTTGKIPESQKWNREKAQAEAMSHFFTSPQYEWNLQQGMQGIDRSAAARGLLLSGAQMKAANKFASGLASGEWAGYTGQLANMAGLGQVTAGQGAQLGAQYANMGGNALQYMGNARGSGYINQANAMNSGLGNLSYLANRYGGGYGQQPYNSGWQYHQYQGADPAFQGSYSGGQLYQPGG